ncbi:MAG: hypothetical protein H7831_17115 [Magnetococcus sp. WYHC-3]
MNNESLGLHCTKNKRHKWSEGTSDEQTCVRCGIERLKYRSLYNAAYRARSKEAKVNPDLVKQPVHPTLILKALADGQQAQILVGGDWKNCSLNIALGLLSKGQTDRVRAVMVERVTLGLLPRDIENIPWLSRVAYTQLIYTPSTDTITAEVTLR